MRRWGPRRAARAPRARSVRWATPSFQAHPRPASRSGGASARRRTSRPVSADKSRSVDTSLTPRAPHNLLAKLRGGSVTTKGLSGVASPNIGFTTNADVRSTRGGPQFRPPRSAPAASSATATMRHRRGRTPRARRRRGSESCRRGGSRLPTGASASASDRRPSRRKRRPHASADAVGLGSPALVAAHLGERLSAQTSAMFLRHTRIGLLCTLPW